jgi:hypothetical protein
MGVFDFITKTKPSTNSTTGDDDNDRILQTPFSSVKYPLQSGAKSPAPQKKDNSSSKIINDWLPKPDIEEINPPMPSVTLGVKPAADSTSVQLPPLPSRNSNPVMVEDLKQSSKALTKKDHQEKNFMNPLIQEEIEALTLKPDYKPAQKNPLMQSSPKPQIQSSPASVTDWSKEVLPKPVDTLNQAEVLRPEVPASVDSDEGLVQEPVVEPPSLSSFILPTSTEVTQNVETNIEQSDDPIHEGIQKLQDVIKGEINEISQDTLVVDNLQVDPEIEVKVENEKEIPQAEITAPEALKTDAQTTETALSQIEIGTDAPKLPENKAKPEPAPVFLKHTDTLNTQGNSGIKKDVDKPVQVANETLKIQNLKSLKRIAFAGLNTNSTNPNVSQKITNLVKALKGSNIELLIDSDKGYSKDIKTAWGENPLTKIFLKPQFSDFRDQVESAADSSKVYENTNYNDKFKALVSSSDVVIVPETDGVHNYAMFMQLWAIAFLYLGQHKPLILFGKNWTITVKKIQDTFAFSDDVMKTLIVCEDENTCIKILQQLDDEYTKKPEVKISETDESGYFFHQ